MVFVFRRVNSDNIVQAERLATQMQAYRATDKNA